MPSFTARVVASIAAVDPAAWDACANPPGRSEDEAEGERFNPFVAHAFLLCAGSVRLDRRAVGLDAGACDRRGRRRAHGRRRAVLSQEPQPRRICVRPRLGRRLSSAPAGATIPSSRSPRPSRRRPGGACSSRPTRPHGAREALIAGLRELRRQTKASSIHVTFPTAEDAARLERAGFLRPPRRAVPFPLRGLSRRSTIFSPRSPRASARRSSASGGRRWATTSRSNG